MKNTQKKVAIQPGVTAPPGIGTALSISRPLNIPGQPPWRFSIAPKRNFVLKVILTQPDERPCHIYGSRSLVDSEPLIRPWLPKTEMKVMAKSTNVRYRTLSKALKVIDPSGTLVPGTRQHNRISSLIGEWIYQCGPEYALCMAKNGSEHLDRWWKFL
jgi:hypothetical protein